ncbi:MAG: hypothetical protein H6847_04020 [Hyphomonas sp.]|nr:hypothetical protein [Hyphomonas sp.]
MPAHGRIAPALGAVLEGLKLAAREYDGAAEDAARRRWVAVGLVSALQAALVAALSGYESAAAEDAEDPSRPGRLGPVVLLLRRARSPEFLNPPERLDLSGEAQRGIAAVIDARNDVLHALGEGTALPEDAAFRSVLAAIRHACLDHPAFRPDEHGVLLALIGDEISALERATGQAG